MAEIAYYSDMDVDVYEDESFSLVNFLSSVKTSILNLLPALPLYYPQTERYLSEIPLPNGKKLFISDANSASTRELLEAHNIGGIVSIRTSYAYLSPIYKNIDELDDDYEIHRIHMNDNPHTSLIEHMNPIIQFIEEHTTDTQHVLIHCTAGKSRSVSFVILYLMIKHKQRYQTALDLIKTIRPEININEGFIRQLESIDSLLFSQI